MQIDRRITNGLAWAGAILVVAIPAADFVLNQTSSATPQIAAVQEEAFAPETLPTSASQRPAAEPVQADVQADEPAEIETPDPVVTASAGPSSGTAVDSFLESGRPLPSYISGGTSSTAPAATAPRPATIVPATTPPPATATTPRPATTPVSPAEPAQPSVSATPPIPAVTLPTPVSQRPPSVAQNAVRPTTTPAPIPVQQPPLIIDDEPPVLTADDLADWESGPLSDFLAQRRGGSQPEIDYEDDGIYVDQGSDVVVERLTPRNYGEGFYYPFSN